MKFLIVEKEMEPIAPKQKYESDQGGEDYKERINDRRRGKEFQIWNKYYQFVH